MPLVLCLYTDHVLYTGYVKEIRVGFVSGMPFMYLSLSSHEGTQCIKWLNASDNYFDSKQVYNNGCHVCIGSIIVKGVYSSS